MQLVEQHCISKNDPGYSVLDEAAFKSKNLYHAALYEIRQSFFQEGRNILIYTVQAISKRGLKRGLIQPSRLSISIKTKQGTLILGKNPLWKPECGMGRKNNQNFVSIPHGRFIDMITYKAALVGIQVEVREESYTSKASFLDLDPLPDYQPNHEEEHIFSGRRIGRRNRLYRTKDGRKICAASNGAYNSVRKSRPHAFAKGIAGYVVHPVRLAV